MQPYSFRDSENAQRLTKNMCVCVGGEISFFFLLLLMVIKNWAACLKAEVKQIKPQLRPFRNCLLFLEISCFIHKDDF